ncbi:MAG: alpha/beta fold hydrolase [Chloroflexota bacterium]
MDLSTAPAQLAVNGVLLHYLDQGHGVPVVFVHGSVNDYRSWSPQIAPFADQYRVITYGRRYHYPNRAPGPGAAYAAATQVDDLATLVRELGLGAVHLVGSSYGALVALVLAAQQPVLVRTLGFSGIFAAPLAGVRRGAARAGAGDQNWLGRTWPVSSPSVCSPVPPLVPDSTPA